MTTLSSKQTFLMKFVFPALWFGAFGLGAGLVLSHPETAPVPPMVLGLYLAACCVGSVLIYLYNVPLKRVRVDGATLYVSNYRKEIAVPASSIEKVTENRWINIHPVTLHLRAPGEFGSSLIFMPTLRWWANWEPHPVVKELEALALREPKGLSQEAKR